MARRLTVAPLLAALLAGTVIAPAAAARELPLSARGSFRLGDSGVLCTAQVRPTDPRLAGLFDRAYLLTCRDAAAPVGSVVALRQPVAAEGLASALVDRALRCAAKGSEGMEGVGEVQRFDCRDEEARVDYRRYAVSRGKTHYVVEGLAGYDPALKLALVSVVTNQPQKGEVKVATTEVSDAAAFARIQAGALDPGGARREAYLRSNGARFAEAAQFFESIASRENDRALLAEARANQGLQQSNLGNYAAAERLFVEADRAVPSNDGVTQRLIRNYRALNQLNQRRPDSALTELARVVAPVEEPGESERIREGLISVPLAEAINRGSASNQQVSQVTSTLTPAERAALLDAQALELSGIADRQAGRLDAAMSKYADATAKLIAIRDGKLLAGSWLQSEIDLERALISEARGEHGVAASAYDRAIQSLNASFPESPTLLAAKARKAAFLARTNDSASARTLYDELVRQSAGIPDSSAALRDLLKPYFDLLAADGSAESAAAMFRAAQMLERPGVAQTQAILARQLSEGNDEASELFRLALARTRAIVRAEGEIARLGALAAPSPAEVAALDTAKANLEALRAEQTSLQSKLADYPRYKVLAPAQIELDELRAALREGETYYKMMVVGDQVYALTFSKGNARTLRLGIGASALADTVAAVRQSIIRTDGDELVTDPFDLTRARSLYQALFGPIDAEVRATKHLIFEPDGAMLQLPPYVLPASQQGVDRYLARQKAPNADPYDFTGVEWLGRGREVSISVGPRSFLDMRSLPPSNAANAYLGLGANAPAVARPVAAAADECDWPIQTWQAPISADELVAAERLFGARGAALKTGEAFTDQALLADPALDDYRILHFATHGLVTPPRPECPARPALVTSFGGEGSDGLLSFREIFDLNLNADLVILSACDTAGTATAAASREAGVATGGNYALDGLVRAFIGAGARSVVASHWPVPDDYDATKRLVTGLIDARPGQPIAQSLELAQQGLMDDPKTSHPFYWAAFIVLGDGAKPLVSSRQAEARPTGPATASR